MLGLSREEKIQRFNRHYDKGKLSIYVFLQENRESIKFRNEKLATDEYFGIFSTQVIEYLMGEQYSRADIVANEYTEDETKNKIMKIQPHIHELTETFVNDNGWVRTANSKALIEKLADLHNYRHKNLTGLKAGWVGSEEDLRMQEVRYILMRQGGNINY